MSEVLLRLGTAVLCAAGLAGQAALQKPLGHQNEVRDVRKLHLTPSSMAFRLAAGGVKEAAADALWLATLPRLGKPWVDPERKAAWIESVSTVMIDANPRALTVPLYANKFLELTDLESPAIDRILMRAMNAEQRPPFGERHAVNADSWELPHELMMNRYMRYHQYGRDEALVEAVTWGTVASKKTDCPRIIIDFVSRLETQRGNELAGWLLYLSREADTPNPEWRDDYRKEANYQRRAALLDWAHDFEIHEERFPRSPAEAMRYALPTTLQTLRNNPDLAAAFLEGVEFRPAARDVRVSEYSEFMNNEQLRILDEYALVFENEEGHAPRSLKDFALVARLPTPVEHGFRWDFDAVDGSWSLKDDRQDPRLYFRWEPPGLHGPRPGKR